MTILSRDEAGDVEDILATNITYYFACENYSNQYAEGIPAGEFQIHPNFSGNGSCGYDHAVISIPDKFQNLLELYNDRSLPRSPHLGSYNAAFLKYLKPGHNIVVIVRYSTFNFILVFYVCL